MRGPLFRRVAAPLLAVGLGMSLAACGPMGPGESAPSTAPAETTESEADATSGTGGESSECADVQATLGTVQERLEGLPDKVMTDIPGAISDVQTSVDELTTLSDGVEDSELKGHIDGVIGHGNEALEILGQAQSGEITPMEALSQGSAKIGELQEDVTAIQEYCAAA